jgi:hypothetical protein
MRAMDYAEVRAAFFQPRDATAVAGTTAWQSPARQLRDAIEPIAMLYCWSEPAQAAYAARGLDFLTGYVWARACVLGEPDGSVVAAAFAVFEPGMIIQLYDAARAACPLADIRAASAGQSAAALRAALGQPEPERAAEAASALRRGLQAADPAGRSLFAGLAARPWPADELGQLWHACALLRELRGDSHVAAFVAAGITGLEANILTELQVGWPPLAYTATRGWPDEAMQAASWRLAERGLIADGALTAAGSALRADIEDATDRQLDPVLAAIGPDLAGLLPLLGEWSQRVIDHGWFPPDPFKRASG